jgi:hypothetical protein
MKVGARCERDARLDTSTRRRALRRSLCHSTRPAASAGDTVSAQQRVMTARGCATRDGSYRKQFARAGLGSSRGSCAARHRLPTPAPTPDSASGRPALRGLPDVQSHWREAIRRSHSCDSAVASVMTPALIDPMDEGAVTGHRERGGLTVLSTHRNPRPPTRAGEEKSGICLVAGRAQGAGRKTDGRRSDCRGPNASSFELTHATYGHYRFDI